MRLVIFDGLIYRLSEAAYEAALRLIAAGQWSAIDLDSLGKFLGPLAADFSDMQVDEAERALREVAA